jgi:uncharacterized membrane protein YdjX (TVP38/TMEM64 family)
VVRAVTRRRSVLLGAGLAAIAATAVTAHVSQGRIEPALQAGILDLGASGPLGWGLVVVAMTAVAISGVLPASLCGLAAGAAFGLALGFALAGSATSAAAILAFALARTRLRPWASRRLARWPQAGQLVEAMRGAGWATICLLRLSPVMPFAATSWALGLTPLGWRPYLVGTCASLPALFGYVLIGHLATTGSHAAWTHWAGWGEAMLQGAGLAATCLLTLRAGWVLRRLLRQRADLPSLP